MISALESYSPPRVDPPGASDGSAGPRVLIVDDSPMIRTIIASHLRKSGIAEIDFANDGVEAFDLALRRLPDLVITDLSMPNMDGFELCRLLRADQILVFQKTKLSLLPSIPS